MYATTFLMRDGRVANLDAHLRRLRTETTFHPSAEEEVLATLRSAGPGVFRPHIEVVGSTVSVDLRPAVMPNDDVVVNAEGIRDERRRPTRKGPDFGWQVHQLQRVRNQGADAGLLVDDRGNIISGIFSSVLYLSGGTAHVSAHPRAAQSITLDATLAMLIDAGVDVIEHPQGLPMHQLRTKETWLMSSLEGVRNVTGWMEYGSTLPPQITGLPRGGAPTHREINERMWAAAGSV